MYLGSDESMLTQRGIERMMRAIQRFHYASAQDANPIIAARHNGYAIALIGVLRDLASDEEIKKATGEDARLLHREIMAVQDQHEGMAFKALAALKAKGIDVETVLREHLKKK